MAGIYIHIPFCKQACYYCDFHFSTNASASAEMVEALEQELLLQKDYLGGEKINTIYLGGGTPSLLSADQLASLFASLQSHFQIASKAEITLEANPDDVSREKLESLRDLGVNRLSIGIQSFDDAILHYLNRPHNAFEARQCV